MTEPYVPLQRVLGCVSIGGLVNKVEEDIRNLPRVELNTDGTIPCSIPKELEVAILNLLDWSTKIGWSEQGKSLVDNLKRCLTNALQGQCEMHVSKQRQEELEQAEKLLEVVCQHADKYPESYTKYMFTGNVEGLMEWWTKRKPKTEREKKLEKVQAVVKEWWPEGMDGPQARMAEDILKALETN